MLIIIAESRHKCQKSMHYPVYAGLDCRLSRGSKSAGSRGSADFIVSWILPTQPCARLDRIIYCDGYGQASKRPFQFCTAPMTPFACMSAKIDAAAFAALMSLPTNRAPPALTWPVPTHKLRPLDASIKPGAEIGLAPKSVRGRGNPSARAPVGNAAKIGGRGPAIGAAEDGPCIFADHAGIAHGYDQNRANTLRHQVALDLRIGILPGRL